MRDFLRSLPVFAGLVRDFDVEALPHDPTDLFVRWLHEAVEDGVPEPHAMTLSTSGTDGVPDARILILKDLDQQGWWFATNVESAKGTQLTAHAAAALTFYWPLVARQVRVRGPITVGSADLSATDFRARGSGARAVALASDESQEVADRATCARAVAEAQQRISEQPDLVAPSWQVYILAADTVEFWQADKGRQHTRVQYCRRGDEWDRRLLWP